jgi:hypothetical protein
VENGVSGRASLSFKFFPVVLSGVGLLCLSMSGEKGISLEI